MVVYLQAAKRPCLREPDGHDLGAGGAREDRDGRLKERIFADSKTLNREDL